MNRAEIYAILDKFAPQELAEKWDCVGALVETKQTEIKKVMLALTVTNDIVKQATEQECDMILSHHPLFFVPFEYKYINIFSAHTNLDRTQGGTSDTLIADLGYKSYTILNERETALPFLRYVDVKTTVKDFANILRKVSPNLRYVNNLGIEKLEKIAFCAGSGSEFIKEAHDNGTDAFVTGDLKFHTALDSQIVVFDIGHFESEILVLKVFENLLKDKVEIVYAQEKSPFVYWK